MASEVVCSISPFTHNSDNGEEIIMNYKIDEYEGYGRPPRETYYVEGLAELFERILYALWVDKCGHVEVSVVQSSTPKVIK